jgi:hypothetical protein
MTARASDGGERVARDELRRAGASRRLDPLSLAAGIGLLVFGAVLLADALDAIDLGFPALAPLACFLVGVVLLATGLTRRD